MSRAATACRLVLVACLLGLSSGAARSQPAPPRSGTAMPARLRIALVPLDDRPVCLQYPQMMAALAHAAVISPPPAALGRFTTPGDTGAIATWLRAQDWTTIDALIVSIDMVAYGGLVASRVHDVNRATALARIDVIREIRAARPTLPIYGFSVLMRLAPTADGRNEAYREQLARWAELAGGSRSAAESEELQALVREIPPVALDDYRRARRRNRAVNLASVGLVEQAVIDYLVVSQDDARPRGVHLADRALVTRRARGGRATSRIGIQPGADEVAMILLARAVLRRHGLQPSVRAIWSTDQARLMVAPFEDRPLHETVRFQVEASGARPVERGGPTADLDLYVFASRHDPGVPERFAATVAQQVAAGARAIVADVDPKGDVQGASVAFTEALLAAGIFPKLYGYASWNTAGNTIGTAIPHGLLAWAGATLASRCSSPAWTALADAQVTFLLHRLLNDFAYQGVLRPSLNADLRASDRNPASLTPDDEVVQRIVAALAPRLQSFARHFTTAAHVLPSPAPTDVAVQVGAPTGLRVSLPWARTFEAAISFEVPVAGLSVPARRLPACQAATP
ncbi:MAG: DUF4127 family protein [Acidobacteria bacterium]|nr:DUF4127 family protein [Acidobacteriota bacterium]